MSQDGPEYHPGLAVYLPVAFGKASVRHVCLRTRPPASEFRTFFTLYDGRLLREFEPAADNG